MSVERGIIAVDDEKIVAPNQLQPAVLDVFQSVHPDQAGMTDLAEKIW